VSTILIFIYTCILSNEARLEIHINSLH